MRRSKICFLLTKEEMRLFKSVLYLEPCLSDGIEKAKAKGGKHRVKFFIEDLAESLEALSFSMSHTQSCSEKEKLHSLYNKIKGYLLLSQGLRQSAGRKGIMRKV